MRKTDLRPASFRSGSDIARLSDNTPKKLRHRVRNSLRQECASDGGIVAGKSVALRVRVSVSFFSAKKKFSAYTKTI